MSPPPDDLLQNWLNKPDTNVLGCRSDQMAVTISSPHLELTFPNGNDGAIVKLPVFSAKDSIGGTISVNPAAYPNSSNAKIVVSVSRIVADGLIPYCLYDMCSWKEPYIGQNHDQLRLSGQVPSQSADILIKKARRPSSSLRLWRGSISFSSPP